MLERYIFRISFYSRKLKKRTFRNFQIDVPICEPDSPHHFSEHTRNYTYAVGAAYLNCASQSVTVYLLSCKLLEEKAYECENNCY